MWECVSRYERVGTNVVVLLHKGVEDMTSEHFSRRRIWRPRRVVTGTLLLYLCGEHLGRSTGQLPWKRRHGKDSGAKMEKRWDGLVRRGGRLRWRVGLGADRLTSRPVSSVKPPPDHLCHPRKLIRVFLGR
jgi:hypothetical protein